MFRFFGGAPKLLILDNLKSGVAACDWIAERRSLLNTGASGLDKGSLACALGHKACRENLSVLYTRMPRLFVDLAIAHGDAHYARFLRSLARIQLLILDDWGPEALIPIRHDLLENVADRYDKGSIIITSQVPIDRWHEVLGAKNHCVDPRKQTPGGRHQIGIPAGFKSESAALAPRRFWKTTKS
jgi:DNA replication protein DnaC